MTDEKKIYNITEYKSIQMAINELEPLSTLQLEGKAYDESIVIDKKSPS